VDSRAFEAAIADVARRLASIPAVMDVRSPLDRTSSDQISADRVEGVD
jgi:hypothetical protein